MERHVSHIQLILYHYSVSPGQVTGGTVDWQGVGDVLGPCICAESKPHSWGLWQSGAAWICTAEISGTDQIRIDPLGLLLCCLG